MKTGAKPLLGFAQRWLPWIVAGAALVVYALTLTQWARPNTLATLGSVAGWGLYVPVQAPLLHLITRPVRLLPDGVQPLVLNGVTALAAALALAFLARTVSLLPFDRTPGLRMRELGASALLSHRLAWVPVALACALCGLQRSFWEHATALSGEMLDLLVFACLIRCLLEYRIDRRDRWLIALAFVYGLGVANSYALIAFFPGFLAAVALVKSWDFLRLRFLAAMLAAGAAGLLIYLYFPLTVPAETGVQGSFGGHLKAVMQTQWTALRSVPLWIVLLLSFTSILPTVLISIRWSKAGLGTGGPAEPLLNLLLILLHIALLFGCISIFFDPPWGPRALGRGLAFLPLYYLAAICAGYFAGYFLLMTRPAQEKNWRYGPGLLERMGPLAPGLVLVLVVAAPAVLVMRNWGPMRAARVTLLARVADRMAASLPAEGAYVFGDMADDLMLIEARLRATRGGHPHVLIFTRWLDSPQYHLRLAARYGPRWPVPPDLAKWTGPINDRVLLERMVLVARSNQVFYLNPSAGPYFEILRLRPQGLIWRAEVLPPDPALPLPFTERDLDPARRFWEAAAPEVEALLGDARTDRGRLYQELIYSRALNHWGVTLQRQADAAGATRWFDLASRLNTNNIVARVNRAYNSVLRNAPTPDPAGTNVPGPPTDPRVLESIRVLHGPADQPLWAVAAGQVFAQGGLYRQALIEFDRAQKLMPTNQIVGLWRGCMEAMTRLRFGDVAGAERQSLELQTRFPDQEIAWESLTRVYLVSGRLTNALESVDRQLQLNPTNVSTLLNKAAFHIQLGQSTQAIPPLDRLLAQQPNNQAARLNRAIAHLQSGHLDQAQRDYEALAAEAPRSADVHLGLGEIAARRKDAAAAIAHFEEYLKNTRPDSAAHRAIARRVEELKGKSPAPGK